MSKMGDVYLQLQEQAEERGFEGVEEMEQAGFKWRVETVDGDNIAMWYKPEDDLEEAYKDWKQEKKEVMDDLVMLRDGTWDDDPEQQKYVINRAIEFVKGANL